jgi:hypothetical protein
MNVVEVLFFEGCPHAELALSRAREAAASAGSPTEVRLVRIESEDAAIERRFLGSPSVRVNGEDVEPSARDRSDFGLQCRVYEIDGAIEGAPPTRWITERLASSSGRS